MTTIHRGLMGAATQTPTSAADQLRAVQQRIAQRRQSVQPVQQRAPQAATLNPVPQRPGIMGAPAVQQQAMPAKPAGMPAAPSAISQPVPGVRIPDAGSGPRTMKVADMPSTPHAPPPLPTM